MIDPAPLLVLPGEIEGTGATLGIGISGLLLPNMVLLREIPTNLFWYFANQSTPNSSLLLSVNWPMTVLRATWGALTYISSKIFSTFTTTSRLPRMMMLFAR